VLVAFSFSSATAFAKNDEKPPTTQKWSVSFARDTAIIRASSQTDVKLIQAMIKTLQEIGVEKFALRSNEAGIAPPKTNPSFTITLVTDEAQMSTSNNVPYKYVIAAVSMLAENGVKKIRFSPAQKSDAPAARPKTKKAS